MIHQFSIIHYWYPHDSPLIDHKLSISSENYSNIPRKNLRRRVAPPWVAPPSCRWRSSQTPTAQLFWITGIPASHSEIQGLVIPCEPFSDLHGIFHDFQGFLWIDPLVIPFWLDADGWKWRKGRNHQPTTVDHECGWWNQAVASESTSRFSFRAGWGEYLDLSQRMWLTYTYMQSANEYKRVNCWPRELVATPLIYCTQIPSDWEIHVIRIYQHEVFLDKYPTSMHEVYPLTKKL